MSRFGIGAARSAARRLRHLGAHARADGPAAVLRRLRGDSSPGSSFELHTKRLKIRPLEERDVETLLRYRNIAGMETFQDWSIPYSREDALALVEQSRRHAGPAPGEWVQLGVEADGEMVGDVAIWLDGSGLVAEIGATIAPEYHARGFAVEMVNGIIDWLFQERRVHRIRASHDPRNVASAIALDRLGFEYVGTIRSGHHVRGEWVDDATWSLLEDDWRERRTLAAQQVGAVALAELTPESIRALRAIKPAFLHRDIATTADLTIADALIPPTRTSSPVPMRVLAISADDEPVGYLVVAEPIGDGEHPCLWRIVVDHRHGGRGIERLAVAELARRYEAAGHSRLDAYYPAGPGRLGSMYHSIGFAPIGQHGDAELARLDLTTFSG